MRVRPIVRSPQLPTLAVVAFWGLTTLTLVDLAASASEPNLRHPAVTASAAVTVGWMLLGWALMLIPSARPHARLVWTLGAAALLAHLVLAFGVGHGWSHAAAVEHVREVGGYGAGIVVNYLFAVVWIADVIWWWANPDGRTTRSRWVNGTIHGFLLFVVVNATVVFGPPERRVGYALALGAVALLACWRLGRV